MLNLFIILLTNLFTGVIIYLVLSLRLEKSSTEYHAKKFKREAEEMIREFNASAERNISLLENRINILKKLLKISGNLETIDIKSISEDNIKDKHEYSITKNVSDIKTASEQKDQHSYLVDDKIELSLLSKDETETGIESEHLSEENKREEFLTRFSSAGNKHDILVEYYKNGLPLDALCEYSGISVSEVKLILNLNGIDMR